MFSFGFGYLGLVADATAVPLSSCSIASAVIDKQIQAELDKLQDQINNDTRIREMLPSQATSADVQTYIDQFKQAAAGYGAEVKSVTATPDDTNGTITVTWEIQAGPVSVTGSRTFTGFKTSTDQTPTNPGTGGTEGDNSQGQEPSTGGNGGGEGNNQNTEGNGSGSEEGQGQEQQNSEQETPK